MQLVAERFQKSMGDKPPAGIHLTVKPVGPLCNLNCTYCYYLEKEAFFPKNNNYRMSDTVLNALIHKTFLSKSVPEATFCWQGGEPAIMGLDFFRRAITLQKKYARGSRVINVFQTNGTLLNDEWCEFFSENNFLIGLSLDGTQEIHDHYRVDREGNPTFEKVIRALELLKKHNVNYNVLSTINRNSSLYPLEIYRFFKECGVEFMQFLPVVEREPGPASKKLGIRLSKPPENGQADLSKSVTPWSVEPEKYGDFLTRIFDHWVRYDVGSVYVTNFEFALAQWLGLPSNECMFSKHCGRCLAIEHNGDVYSCDHYVYPDYHLGNILHTPPMKLLNSKKQVAFGRAKETTLPPDCRDCVALFACHGGCQKDRFINGTGGETGLNYLCAGYKKYFFHIDRYMRVMGKLIHRGLPGNQIMKVVDTPFFDTL